MVSQSSGGWLPREDGVFTSTPRDSGDSGVEEGDSLAGSESSNAAMNRKRRKNRRKSVDESKARRRTKRPDHHRRKSSDSVSEDEEMEDDDEDDRTSVETDSLRTSTPETVASSTTSSSSRIPTPTEEEEEKDDHVAELNDCDMKKSEQPRASLTEGGRPLSPPPRPAKKKRNRIFKWISNRWNFHSDNFAYALLVSVCSVLYWNSLDCGFVFDDMTAVKDNKDLRPETPWGNLFYNDFWGTPMWKEQSHKSYRPLTVMTFRFNYLFHGLDPAGYHLVNLAAHALVTVVFYRVALDLVLRTEKSRGVALLAALLFAVHPIHTEAVTGVVGRAELLASFWYLMALIAYSKSIQGGEDRVRNKNVRNRSFDNNATNSKFNNNNYGNSSCDSNYGNAVNARTLGNNKNRLSRHHKMQNEGEKTSSGDKKTIWSWFAASLTCCLFATLSKEQGITGLALCAVYELIYVQKIQEKLDDPRAFSDGLFKNTNSTSKRKNHHQKRPHHRSAVARLLASIPETVKRLALIFVFGLALMMARLRIMGGQLPVFTKFDNPAAGSDSRLTRWLTFAYLPALNGFIMLNPFDLCCDWTMNTVPVIQSFSDLRNLATLFTFGVLGSSVVLVFFGNKKEKEKEPFDKNKDHHKKDDEEEKGEISGKKSETTLSGGAVHQKATATTVTAIVQRRRVNNNLQQVKHSGGRKNSSSSCSSSFEVGGGNQLDRRVNKGQQKAVILSLSMIIFPFLPASNLFFPVGFVVAERVLYLPSMGFALLVAMGFERLMFNNNKNNLTNFGLVSVLAFTLITHSLRSAVRNVDWRDEISLFKAGLKVTEGNAKLFSNVGHALEAKGEFVDALRYYERAVDVQPDDIGAHINLGRTLNHMKEFEAAEEAYTKAKNLLPQSRSGETYYARVAPSHLNVFHNLATLISKNGSRLEEADALYRQAISMREDYTQAYINRGDILLKMNKTSEAQAVYERALTIESDNPDLLYNLGVVLLNQQKVAEALTYLNRALEIDPNHEQALLNSAVLIQESGANHLRPLAIDRLKKIVERGEANERVYFNLGMLHMDSGKAVEAEAWFRKAIAEKPDFRSALFNLALLMSENGRAGESEPVLNQLLAHHPDHVKGLILLGDFYVNQKGDLAEAEKCYRKILKMDPRNVQGMHNLCVVILEKNPQQADNLIEARDCLLQVVALAPKEEYVKRHLQIVEERLALIHNRNPDL